VSRGVLAVPAPPHVAVLRSAGLLTHGLTSRSLPRPGLLLAVGATAVAGLMLVEAENVAGLAGPAEAAHMLVASFAGVGALVLMAVRPGQQILDYRRLALGMAFVASGLIGVEVVPSLGNVSVVLANSLFLVGGALALPVVVPALYRTPDKRARVGWILDSLIMTAAGSAFAVTIWRSGGETQAGIEQFLVPALAAVLLGSTAMPVIAALSRNIVIRPSGMWAAIAACLLLSWSWILWLDCCLHGRPRVELVGVCYSTGMLVLGWAWVTWSEAKSESRLYAAVAQRLADVLPAGSVFVCVAIAALPHGRIGQFDPAYVGTVVVVLLTLARQRLLILNERLSSRRLACEVEERAQTMLSLSTLESAETPEATAARICEEAMRLDGIDAAAVYVFSPTDSVVPIAHAGRRPDDEVACEAVGSDRAFHLLASAGFGAWVDSPFDFAPSGASLSGGGGSSAGRATDGRAEAFAPMRWDDRVVGVVAVSTSDPDQMRRLPERLSTVSEFGVVSSALMGPLLEKHWQMNDLRSRLEDLMAQHAFWPVFQSVVRLADREAVGYEALTRFADGSRPDERFAQANEAGMTVKFEMACLQAQLEAATWLPEDTWLSVNVSPALATAIVPLVSTLAMADRDIVFEITEHVEVGDYVALGSALELVRGRARLAVDDAGAGYAGLRHILELHPQFVKLDLNIVRNVDTDRARQAMVAGMAHFAGNSGCELIAEGIETEAELATLIRLGVTYGQGYLFGKPAPIG
jgi:EAL domain-containing protein (putative c-di-GMP-specific phosphodiesterase class I)